MASTTASRLLSAVSGRRCLLTVGTTNFDSLIRHLDSPANAPLFLQLLSSLGFSHLTIQLGGTSTYTPTHLPSVAASLTPTFTVDLLHLTPSLSSLYLSSSLVLSHAGAGSIVESLRLRIPLIVVVNESLMDNHQLQLARALAMHRYLYMATVHNVLAVLRGLDEDRLKVHEKGAEGGKEEEEEEEEKGVEDDGERDGTLDESMWGTRGEAVFVRYKLRPYPPASSTGFLNVLDEEMDML